MPILITQIGTRQLLLNNNTNGILYYVVYHLLFIINLKMYNF